MNKLITITYYGNTKHLIDVAFTKAEAERRIVLDRKEYESWIERTDKNDTSFSYTDHEGRTVALPCTVPMDKYWAEMDDAHIESHLYDYIISNHLHYDEILQASTIASPTHQRHNVTASVPGLYGSKEAFEEEQAARVITEDDLMMVQIFEGFPYAQ